MPSLPPINQPRDFLPIYVLPKFLEIYNAQKYRTVEIYSNNQRNSIRSFNLEKK